MVRTSHEPVTNQSRTSHEPVTNQSRTSHEPVTNQSRTRHEPVTNQSRTRHDPGTNQARTKHEPGTNQARLQKLLSASKQSSIVRTTNKRKRHAASINSNTSTQTPNITDLLSPQIKEGFSACILPIRHLPQTCLQRKSRLHKDKSTIFTLTTSESSFVQE